MRTADILCWAILILFWVFYFWNWSKKEKHWIIGLGMFLFHFSMTFLAFQYLKEVGGDSTVYWRVANFPEENWGEWIYVLPYSAGYFIWAVRPFAYYLGLSYLSGTLIFSSLGMMGFLWLYQWISSYTIKFEKAQFPISVLFILILFLPNAHFWTSLVGKESLLFFLTVLALKLAFDKKFGLMAIPLILCILIRPVFGLIFLAVLSVFLFQYVRWSLLQKLILGILIGFLTLMAINFIVVYVDDFEWNLQIFENYAQFQYSRFNASDAYTKIPMENYSWPLRVFSVAYRPLIFEFSEGFWMLFLQIENTILLLLSLGIPITLYRHPRLIPYFLLISLFLFSIAVSTNVFGAFVRLKSLVTPFLALMGGWGWMILHSNIRSISRRDS
ncbi:hypothetical protein [uncultured Algoriphagus sp.]|uniref:hypothetical protein n=1 Tax=uncultured Algoriphagus sp. TaxID=417365 RepID=UPI0025885A87|nr:hypothetical protein [uncultured Algoriphagus sp.]